MIIHPSSVIDPSAKLGEGVSVGPFSIIGPEVKIGNGTVIGSHVLIEANTIIGKACKIFQKGSELKYLFKNNHFETKLLICRKIAQHHSLDIFRTYSYPKNIAKLSPSPSPS